MATHLHTDHYRGLKELKEVYPVHRTVLSGNAGQRIDLGNGEAVEILWPIQRDDSVEDENRNSMIFRVTVRGIRILVTGDITGEGERMLLERYRGTDALKCDVLKVANHADNDTNSPAFTQRTSPAVAVISTSGAEKPDTPDPRVVRMLQEQGAAVYVTEACTGGVLVRLTGGTPEVTLRNVPESETKASLIRAVPGDDLITLRCESGTGDLSGWVLASDKGKEMYVFPEGTQLQPGSSLTIGTKSSPQGSWDLLWDEKKVVNAKKEDIFTLYDAAGTRISSVSNGL